MVTIYDIAKVCGLSPSTVSKVINNYPTISEKTKNKVYDAMKTLNYIPNTNAQILSKGRSNSVGILSYFDMSLSPFSHPLFMEILNSFQQEMNKFQYELLFISRNVGSHQGTFLQNCLSREIDGVLMLGDFTNEEMLEVIKSNIPSVGFDYFGTMMDGVTSNNYQMMYDLTSYLISLNHRDIIFITGENSEVTTQRKKGFIDAMKQNHIEIKDENIISSHYLNNTEIRNITISLSDHLPSAIIYPDDYSALIGMNVLLEHGISCPQDVSIAGFDGIAMGQMHYPNLTTAKQNLSQIGIELAHKLINAMNNEEIIYTNSEVAGSLIKGQSTRKI
jgi:LacI family transcriptional regulator